MVFLAQQKVPSRDILQSCPQIFYMQCEHLTFSLFPEEPVHTLLILARGLYESEKNPIKSRRGSDREQRIKAAGKIPSMIESDPW